VQGANGAPGGDGLIHQLSSSGVVKLPQQRLPERGRGVFQDLEQFEHGAVGGDEAQETLGPDGLLQTAQHTLIRPQLFISLTQLAHGEV
jgi:hypothetical protein